MLISDLQQAEKFLNHNVPNIFRSNYNCLLN